MQKSNMHIVNSALWAAYGDALGFISELANGSMVESRVGKASISHTVPWTRRVGGRFGVECDLPAGCYSDDTQLRLATCRAIRPDGSFDVEAFAKMELPVWTSYALGAGKGSKAAATSLSRDGVTWFSNFYLAQGSDYIHGGGNGAAMRIQPHVWAEKKDGDVSMLIEAIVKNSISTHGHMRGILGAVFHGLCLRHVIRFGEIPGFDEWREMVARLVQVPRLVEANHDLRLFWLPTWEDRAQCPLRDACAFVQEEMWRDIALLASLEHADPYRLYKMAVQQIGGFGERERGSGTKTALLSAFLAFTFRREGAEKALQTAANLLGSDTDTIASMTGALLGCVEESPPSGELADREYISALACRLASIGRGEAVDHLQYPDLIKWSPPRTQQDSVIVSEAGLEVLVLGKVKAEGQIFSSKRPDAGTWQWLMLESGQSVLAKRKTNLNALFRDDSQLSQAASKYQQKRIDMPVSQLEFFPDDDSSDSLDELTKKVIRSGFDPTTIGEHILQLSCSSDGIEKSIAYVAIVAKARRARSKT